MLRQDATALTHRQRETLEWVKDFIRENDIPPTVREIGRAFRIKSSSVFDLLQTLERKGFLKRGSLGARSLIVKGPRRRDQCACVEAPVVGRIAAGQPIEAVELNVGALIVRKDLVCGSDAFALKVVGTSMIDAGILDGDYVVVRRQETAEDGDIVVAIIEGEATLKRFYRNVDGVRLEPANQNMAPIHVTSGEFKIQGRVVGVQRIVGGSTLRTGTEKERGNGTA